MRLHEIWSVSVCNLLTLINRAPLSWLVLRAAETVLPCATKQRPSFIQLSDIDTFATKLHRSLQLKLQDQSFPNKAKTETDLSLYIKQWSLLVIVHFAD